MQSGGSAIGRRRGYMSLHPRLQVLQMINSFILERSQVDLLVVNR